MANLLKTNQKVLNVKVNILSDAEVDELLKDDHVEFYSSMNCESFIIEDINYNLPEYEPETDLPF